MRPMGTGVGERAPRSTVAALDRASGRPGSDWLTLVLVLLFVTNTALMVTGVTHSLDARALHWLRPQDLWGPSQERWAPWMSRLRPQHMYIALAATSLLMAAWRRSLWPLWFGLTVAGASAGLTLLLKLLFRRPDPHDYLAVTGGSYPSGHMVAVLVCLGGCLLVAWPQVRWWWWAPVLVASALMSISLLVGAVHWPSDVVGGVLLALALLSGLRRSTLRRRATESRVTPVRAR